MNEGELGDNPPPRMSFSLLVLQPPRTQKEHVLAEQDIPPPLLSFPKVQCPFRCKEPWTEPPLEGSDGVMHPRKVEAFPYDSVTALGVQLQASPSSMGWLVRLPT